VISRQVCFLRGMDYHHDTSRGSEHKLQRRDCLTSGRIRYPDFKAYAQARIQGTCNTIRVRKSTQKNGSVSACDSTYSTYAGTLALSVTFEATANARTRYNLQLSVALLHNAHWCYCWRHWHPCCIERHSSVKPPTLRRRGRANSLSQLRFATNTSLYSLACARAGTAFSVLHILQYCTFLSSLPWPHESLFVREIPVPLYSPRLLPC